MKMAGLFHLVFVYGTLKKGEPNHSEISSLIPNSCRFIGVAETENQYPLVIASRYNIPFLLDKKGTGRKIIGEVYEVDDELLLKLDKFENHPDYYQRSEDYVVLQSKNEKIAVWIYLLPNFKENLLELPFLSCYNSNGEHGLPYVERYMRKDNTPYVNDVRKK